MYQATETALSARAAYWSGIAPEVEAALRAAGFGTRTTHPEVNGVRTFHFQINDIFGCRVVDFWPGSKRWRDPRTGDSGTLKDVKADLVQLAIERLNSVSKS